jgi:hypothetical protein
MLVRISDYACFQVVRFLLLVCLVCGLVACAHDPPPLIADPNGGRETSLPWNEQAKWERDGSAQGLNTAGRR